MNRILLFTMVCMIVAGSFSSRAATRLELTADAGGSTCSIVDQPGVIEVHFWVRDVDPLGIAGIQFAAPIPACWSGATWLQDNVSYLTIGDSQFNDPRGLSVAFGECLLGEEGGVYVGSMSILASGQSSPCCNFPIVKVPTDLYPEIDGPIVVRCSEPWEVIGVSVGAVVNDDGNCGCLATTPVQETTWGKVKAMYN